VLPDNQSSERWAIAVCIPLHHSLSTDELSRRQSHCVRTLNVLSNRYPLGYALQTDVDCGRFTAISNDKTCCTASADVASVPRTFQGVGIGIAPLQILGLKVKDLQVAKREVA
jgi:hypothetical protein